MKKFVFVNTASGLQIYNIDSVVSVVEGAPDASGNPRSVVRLVSGEMVVATDDIDIVKARFTNAGVL